MPEEASGQEAPRSGCPPAGDGRPLSFRIMKEVFSLVPPRLARVRSETGFGTRSEPDLRPPTLEDDCRWSFPSQTAPEQKRFRFVALFDYSHHMSPNANAEAEELSFRKHQLIKVRPLPSFPLSTYSRSTGKQTATASTRGRSGTATASCRVIW